MFYLTYLLIFSISQPIYLAYLMTFILEAGVQQCPAVPNEIQSWWLGSGSARWDREVAEKIEKEARRREKL